jgi:hypothetical protein
MGVKLSPFGPKPAFFDSNGDPLNDGKLYFYAAGSTTPRDTYTDSGGGTANANPVELNPRGEPDNEIWFTEGLSYKATLKTSADATIWTVDNISGINDTTSAVDQWVASQLTPTYVSATSFTLSGDQTSEFHVGRRLKSTITAGTGYHTITASSFAVNTTTVTVNGTALDSGLSAVSYGILTTTNPSFPVLKDSDLIISGSSDQTKKAVFEADSITTATTRTFTLPDRSSTVATLAGDQTFTGVTKFSGQPAFLAEAAAQTDVTGDGTALNVPFATEVYDQASNFSSPTFTAPVTGKYDFSAQIALAELGAAHTGCILRLATSNRSYEIFYGNPGAIRDASNELRVGNAFIGVDMDAADTAVVSLAISGSTKTVDIVTGASRFSGALRL